MALMTYCCMETFAVVSLFSQTRSRWQENENELVIIRCDKQDSHSKCLSTLCHFFPTRAFLCGICQFLALRGFLVIPGILALILQSKDRTCAFGWLVSSNCRKVWVWVWGSFILLLPSYFCSVKGTIQSKLYYAKK